MGMFKDLDLIEKFQPGVGGMVRSAVIDKKQVKVIPVGFAYNNKTKSFLGSIYIGKPVCFKSENNEIFVNQANIEFDLAKDSYKKFWNYKQKAIDEFRPILHKNIPVLGREQSLYIAGILCENLRICIEKAKRQLPQHPMNIDNIIKI